MSTIAKVINFAKEKFRSYDKDNATMFGYIQEHERMLADNVRLAPYHQGIKKYVKEGDTVIDLGTGTGILSFFAAQKNPKKIYALDHSSIMKVAKLIAQHNNIKNIEFVNINSRNFTLEEKVDIIIHEQIGDFLFEENIIENVTDLRNRLLKPDGRILPNKFEFFIEPIMLHEEYNIPFLWEQHSIFGIDFSCTKEICSTIVGASHNYYGISRGQIEKMLSTEEPGFTFDLEEIEAHSIPKKLLLSRVMKENGRLDGFAVYFKVKFDDNIHFSTHPLGRNTNWAGRMLRVESRNVQMGQRIEFNMDIKKINNPDTWSWVVT